MTQRNQFLNRLAAFLEYKKEEGVETLDISEETQAKFKNATAKKTAPERKPAPRTATAPSRPRAESNPSTESYTVAESFRVKGTTLAQIAAQIATCTECELHTSRTMTVPGEGKSDRPDLP